MAEVAQSEVQRVSSWRAHVASEAGADPETAEKLAQTAGVVDLHEWLTLVKNGCDPRLAYEILEPI